MMDPIPIDRGDFWEFKARCAELDVEAAHLRLKLHAVKEQRRALVDAFAKTHGLDASVPIELDDVALTVTQKGSGDGAEHG